MANTILRSEAELLTLAQTIYGEARGETVHGQIAVGIVIMNRLYAGRWGDTIREVVKAPRQFAVWNPDDLNRYKILEPVEVYSWNVAVWVARLVGQLRDPALELEPKLIGALHYHSRHVHPSWSKGKSACYQIGDHIFYNTVR